MSNGEEWTLTMNDTTTTSRCALAAGSAEDFVRLYSSEHISTEPEASDEYREPSGLCATCRHRRRGQDSCAPEHGDWCHLESGAFGDGRWGECPAWPNNPVTDAEATP